MALLRRPVSLDTHRLDGTFSAWVFGQDEHDAKRADRAQQLKEM